MTAQQLSREELEELERLQRPQCLEDRNAHIVYVPRDHPDSGKLIDSLFAAALKGIEAGELHIVFDGPPSHEGARFIEAETSDGKSLNAGEWRERPDGKWALVIKTLPTAGEREEAAPADDACHCKRCMQATRPEDIGTRMILCPTCGNKRCPHATDHRFACTGSNAPEQVGSDYCSPPTASEGAGKYTRTLALEMVKALRDDDELLLRLSRSETRTEAIFDLCRAGVEKAQPSPTSSPPVGEDKALIDKWMAHGCKLTPTNKPSEDPSPDLDVDGLAKQAIEQGLFGVSNKLREQATALQTLRGENERLNTLLGDTVEDRETAWGSHQLACLEIENLTAERDSLRKDVERLEKSNG